MMNRCIPLLVPVLLYLFLWIPLECKDFGIRGELFTIEEENILFLLQKQLPDKFSYNFMKNLFKSAEERAKDPVSKKVLPNAQKPRVFYFDPTYTAPENITDLKGAIIISKGVKYNPLKSIQLKSGLLFFDGDNREHINWAKEQNESYKWILVHGNPFELEMQENRPVYFDQNGFSVSKLQLKHIPARVTQDELRLKIEEIVLKKEVANP